MIISIGTDKAFETIQHMALLLNIQNSIELTLKT